MDTRKLFFVVLSLFAAAAVAAPASEMEAKREQMRQEAQASYASIERALKATLEKINLNQRLNDEQLKKAAELLETNRRNAALYDTPQKAGYMLLQSWTAYHQNDSTNALNWATRACKEDPNNGDAWATQTLFSLAYGRRPLEPQAIRPRLQTRRLREGQDDVMNEMTTPEAVGYGQPGTLAFDVKTLRREIMRERITLQEFKSADGQEVMYRPGENILCLLFWKTQVEADSNDPFETKPAAAPDAGMPGMPGMPVMPDIGGGYDSSQASPLAEQQAYFEAMAEALADKKEVRFAEISLNAASDAAKIMRDRFSTVPLVFAASAGSGATAFGRIDAASPVMLIIDKEGQIRYAGPAAGFVPAFLLTHLTGVPIDLAALQAEPSEIPAMQMTTPDAPGAPMMAPPMMPGMPGMPPMEGEPMQEAAPTEKKYKELPPEKQVEAEKKLSYVRDLFIRGSRMRIQSYKRGVDMCREIMRDYPGTQYAEEARMLLRQVPENRRSTYNITNEELGL